jgi:hypothetical protein
VVVGWGVEDYEVAEQNLEGLTADISDITINEILRRYQRHIVGIFGSLSRLLHRVARAVVCYREQHP